MTCARWNVVLVHGPQRIYHIVPTADWIDHVTTAGCWCQPILEEAGRVVVHRSADGRECEETLSTYPPATRH
jgi:hypothetical protein